MSLLIRHQQRRVFLLWKNVSVTSKRFRATSAFADFPIPESVKERVKTSILDEAIRPDSRFWGRQEEVNGIQIPGLNGTSVHNHHHQSNNSVNLNGNHRSLQSTEIVHAEGTVDDPIVVAVNQFENSQTNYVLDDPLTDLALRNQSTRYWPDLPTANVVFPSADPFHLAQPELSVMSTNIRAALIGTDHPVLNQAASYFFQSTATSGKQVRPMMVLLLSRALANHYCDDDKETTTHSTTTTTTTNETESAFFTAPFSWQRSDLAAAQRRLAEIAEMMHTASLFHDDVIDEADQRRGVPSLHAALKSNKMAILAGDYLLARASISLARLRNVAVVETMSTIIEHLVRGEVMQMKGNNSSDGNDSSSSSNHSRLDYYLRKNFYKTGSLMAHSCKSAALLGDYPPELVEASYNYGKHVGMAFQLVDDVLDFEGTVSQLGKPLLADLNAGLATAPVLFAASTSSSSSSSGNNSDNTITPQQQQELVTLMDRKFKHEGDVERAVELVNLSDGLEKTKQLARLHAEHAMDAIVELKPSEHRDALLNLAYKVVARTK